MKNLMNSIKFLMACMVIVSMSACGDKNDDPKPDPEPKPVTAKVSYEYTCEPDLLLMAQVSVIYAGADGKEATEVITSSGWKKTLTDVATPFAAKLQIVYTKKDGFTPEKESYRLGHAYGIEYETSNKKKEHPTSSSSMDAPKDKTLELLDRWIDKEKKLSVEIKP